MKLSEWIIERRRRGISSSGDQDFHGAIKSYPEKEFDDLLEALSMPSGVNGELAEAVGWLLSQHPSERHYGLSMVYGVGAKKILLEKLFGTRRAERFLKLDLDEIRTAAPHPVLETAAKAYQGRRYKRLARLQRDAGQVPTETPDWKTVFSRTKDGPDGLPRFYVRESRGFLCSYNGYGSGHKELDQIMEFLGGNKKLNWSGTDSMFNVATYQYRDYYRPEDSLSGGRLEIYGGNYIGSGEPQGAWVIGFRLFRDLVEHLGLKGPRRLKGE